MDNEKQLAALREKEQVRILALESSCDETAAAVIENGRRILSNVVFSQIDLHALYGGVVPEIASRAHVEACDRVVDQVVEYINEHYNEPLTLDDLSERFFISKYHLLRKFDAQVGTTVHRYILQKRLLIAKQLLAGGVAPSEACGYCGFGDYANFYRAFRAEYGMTPRQYVQSVRDTG